MDNDLEWTRPYLRALFYSIEPPGHESPKLLKRWLDCKTKVEINAPRAMLELAIQERFALLKRLKDYNLLAVD